MQPGYLIEQSMMPMMLYATVNASWLPSQAKNDAKNAVHYS